MKQVVVSFTIFFAGALSAQGLSPMVARGLALDTERVLGNLARLTTAMLEQKNDAPLKMYRQEVTSVHEMWVDPKLTTDEKKNLEPYSACGVAIGAMRTALAKLAGGVIVEKTESNSMEKFYERCKIQLAARR
jgi:hypothetical protein